MLYEVGAQYYKLSVEGSNGGIISGSACPALRNVGCGDAFMKLYEISACAATLQVLNNGIYDEAYYLRY